MNTAGTENIQRQLVTAGMSIAQATAKSKLFGSAVDRLTSRRTDSTAAIHAHYIPGRIEFLGKHTDYAGGRSLICAVDRGFCIVASPRTDRTIRILGETAEADLAFPLDPNLIPTAGHWSNYPMTVARRVTQNFPGDLSGADIAFTSDLPASSGLSSSSAMIIAFFMAIASVNDLAHRPEYQTNIKSMLDLSAYLATIENGQTFGTLTGDRGVGTFGGSEDHTAILNAIPGQLSQYSFCPARLERHVPLPPDHTLVIGVSGVIAEKTGAAKAAYNNASLAARAVLDHWNKTTGRREATLAAAVLGSGGADAIRKTLTTDPTLTDRFEQFLGESTQIIPAVGDALLSNRLDQLGQLVDRSQQLATHLLKNQVPETICLAASARECGAIAASSFGAGFGGSVWAMVPAAHVDSFIAHWKTNYQSRHPDAAARAAFFAATAGVPAMPIAIAYPVC